MSGRSHKIGKNLSAALILAILFITCGCAAKEAAPIPDLLPPAGVSDDTAVVIRRDVANDVYLNARLKPEEFNVKFGNISLRVDKVEARPGQEVKKGDVLIRLDVKDLQKNIDTLTEQLADAEKQYGLDGADRQTEIDIARIQLNSLIAGGADQTSVQLQRLSLQRLELVDSQTEESEGTDIDNRRRDIETLTLTIDQAELIADRDGTVVSVPVSPGDYMAPFQTGAVIADNSALYADYAGKTSASGFSAAQSVTARIGGADYDMEYSPVPVKDLIAYIFKGAAPPVKFVFKGAAKAGGLKPGVTAEIRCVWSISKNTLAVPVNAVYMDSSARKYVYLKSKDSAGNAVKRLTFVKTGISNESVAEITEGLSEGDVVYVKP